MEAARVLAQLEISELKTLILICSVLSHVAFAAGPTWVVGVTNAGTCDLAAVSLFWSNDQVHWNNAGGFTFDGGSGALPAQTGNTLTLSSVGGGCNCAVYFQFTVSDVSSTVVSSPVWGGLATTNRTFDGFLLSSPNCVYVPPPPENTNKAYFFYGRVRQPDGSYVRKIVGFKKRSP